MKQEPKNAIEKLYKIIEQVDKARKITMAEMQELIKDLESEIAEIDKRLIEINKKYKNNNELSQAELQDYGALIKKRELDTLNKAYLESLLHHEEVTEYGR